MINEVKQENERSKISHKKGTSKPSQITYSASNYSIINLSKPLNKIREVERVERINSSPLQIQKLFSGDVSSIVSGIETDDREYHINKNIFSSEDSFTSLDPQSLTGRRETHRERLKRESDMNLSSSNIMVKSIMKSCEALDEK